MSANQIMALTSEKEYVYKDRETAEMLLSLMAQEWELVEQFLYILSGTWENLIYNHRRTESISDSSKQGS